MNHDDKIETLEGELAARLGAPLEQLRAVRAHCPPLEAVRALAGDALPLESQAGVKQHVASCAACQALAADLQDEELTGPTASETQRITARVAAGKDEGAQSAAVANASRIAGRRPLSSLWRPALAVAALVALFVVVSRVGVPPPQQAPPVAQTVAPAAVIPAALRFELPDVHLRAAAVLRPRGEGGSRGFVADVAPALDAYRAKNFAEAARQFAALETRHPRAVEVFFYGGVSQLALGQNDAAMRSLEGAARLKEQEFASEIAWYLALAEHRAGRLEAARARLQNLCNGKNAFAARACEAVKALDAPAQ